MTCPSFISDALAQLGECRSFGDAYLVDTHCLYPSGSPVQVTILGGVEQAVVHDGGGASDILSQHGIKYSDINPALRRFTRKRELNIDNGKIVAPRVKLGWLPAAILMVANASKEAADELLRKNKSPQKRDFRESLDLFFKTRFGTERYHRDYRVRGHSEKLHKFDHAVLGEQFTLLVDAVLPDTNSIYARVVANMDVAETEDPNLIRRIVYNENDEWQPSDLRLLGDSATLVPYRYAEDEISKIPLVYS